MKIQSYNQPTFRTLGQQQPPAPNPNPEDPKPPQDNADLTGKDRANAFYQGASSGASFLSEVNGALSGGSIGFMFGGVLGAAAAGSTGALVGSLVGGAGLGYLGFSALSAASDFAGRLGADLDSSNPARGEAAGRNALNVGLCLIGGNWKGAAVNVGISAGSGVVNYAFAGK